MDQSPACALCGSPTRGAGPRVSEFTKREFTIASCDTCGFSFVTEPRTDFAELYDAAYYHGKGADPLTDYEGQLAEPRTIRTYEWRGLTRIVSTLVPFTPSTRWLDFGCGLGGLVRYARENGLEQVYGFDEGYAAQRMIDLGVPSLSTDELTELAGTFDVVTAIEVLEHTPDPIRLLEQMAGMLRPGGALFLTTGNAQAHRGALTSWDYTRCPDVHIAFYEPRTLERLFGMVGFEPRYSGYRKGYTDVIRFKVLTALGFKRRHLLELLVPWPLVSRVLHLRHKVTEHPLGYLR